MTICAVKRCAGKQKIGENMNRKIMILMVAVVATVLPAVAVADVMISGSISVLGSQAPEMVYLSAGPNYGTAHNNNLFTFTNGTGSPTATIGSIELEGMADANVSLLNVLYLNYSVPTSGMLWVNVSETGFPSLAYVELSQNKQTSLSPSAPGVYALNDIPAHNGPISVSQGYGTYYVGFFLPPYPGYNSASMEISVTFIPS